MTIREKCNPEVGYVYFLINEKEWLVKIGHAWDVHTRKWNLQGATSAELKLIWAIPFDRDEAAFREGELHALFRKYHIRGEWFYFWPEIWAFLWLLARLEEGMIEVPQSWVGFLDLFSGRDDREKWFWRKMEHDRTSMKPLMDKWRHRIFARWKSIGMGSAAFPQGEEIDPLKLRRPPEEDYDPLRYGL